VIQNPTQIDDIIWLQTAFLGDIVITTAALDLVKQELPNCRQHIITTPIGSAALKDHRSLDSIVAIDKKKQNLFQSVAAVRRHFHDLNLDKSKSVILQPHKSQRSSLLSKFLGIDTVTYKETNFSILAKTTIDRVAVLHEAERIALLTTALGIERKKTMGIRPSLGAIELQSNIPWQQKLLESNHPWIGISPGSVWGTKRWPGNYYSDLAELILAKYKINLVLMGSGEEKVICDEISKKLFQKSDNPQRILNLAGQTSLGDLQAIYPKLKMLVANDSSAIHYASAFNIPTLSIFGSTVPSMGFGPLALNSLTAQIKDLNCRPCSDHGPSICPLGHFNCMNQLKPKTVFELAENILNKVL